MDRIYVASRVRPETAQRVDAFAKEIQGSRSQAIALLLETGLEAERAKQRLQDSVRFDPMGA